MASNQFTRAACGRWIHCIHVPYGMAELPEAVAPTCPTDLLVRNTRAVHMAAWASQREDTHENGNLQTVLDGAFSWLETHVGST